MRLQDCIRGGRRRPYRAARETGPTGMNRLVRRSQPRLEQVDVADHSERDFAVHLALAGRPEDLGPLGLEPGESQSTFDRHHASSHGLRLSGGRIVHYRDYWNPDVIAQVVGDAHAVSGSQAGGETHDR